MGLFKKLAKILGYELLKIKPVLDNNLNIEERLGYELEDDAVNAIGVVRNYTMLSKRRLVTLYQQVAYCEKHCITGAFVECGVWKGGAMGLMALANLHTGRERRDLHLFDAFTEICEPDAAVDGERAIREVEQYTGRRGQDTGALKPLTGMYDFLGGPGTLEENRTLLEQTIGYPDQFIHYHVGWFQDTIPSDHDDIGPIAILRLDGDWYASTKICLDYLFDKVVVGGIVIIDDYGTYEGCRRAVDEFMQSGRIQAFMGSIDSDCRYFVKQ